MRLWALTWIGLVLAATAPGEDTFQAGDWKGRANFNPEGAFTDCTVLLPDPEGTTLGFVRTHGGSLGMIVADPSLELKPGDEKPALVHAEGLDTLAAMANVVAETGVLIPLVDDSPITDAISAGKEFRVSVREKEFKIQRAGTGKAFEALKACVERNRGKTRMDL